MTLKSRSAKATFSSTKEHSNFIFEGKKHIFMATLTATMSIEEEEEEKSSLWHTKNNNDTKCFFHSSSKEESIKTFP